LTQIPPQCGTYFKGEGGKGLLIMGGMEGEGKGGYF